MLFRERESWTIVLPKSTATAEKLDYMSEWRQITLNVHSSLDAVGFLAAITTELASKLQIGVNPVSGYYHDHLFVPAGTEEQVMKVLHHIQSYFDIYGAFTSIVQVIQAKKSSLYISARQRNDAAKYAIRTPVVIHGCGASQ
ncbi:hypothetical protein CERZMDRAFT_105375 [Cercospora zeae-maydis SCOH1-5]|uniref:CASTOR ACT domain-containing protein n=1 Tax=Cercospora zeae-maydis SCOH1-5 TaxID=717836 RepID=A0A6A6FNR0_9PEZI|nr:hypothetical protein CERZMDRAFT_105375 [Cercospora zeae-maydis SCOH1-5]